MTAPNMDIPRWAQELEESPEAVAAAEAALDAQGQRQRMNAGREGTQTAEAIRRKHEGRRDALDFSRDRG